MTDIEWGPAIAVDGKRPGWLCSGEWRRVRTLAVGEWQTADIESPGDTIPDMDEWNWGDITAIRLPADHPHYRQPAPIDWSGELEAVHEDGRVVAAIATGRYVRWQISGRSWHTHRRDGSTGFAGWRIRNVTPQSTPQADAKPDVTARAPCMTISEVRKMVAKGEDAVIATMLERGYALPEPVDPDLIECRRVMAQRYPDSADNILAGAWDHNAVGDSLACVVACRELALAGETGK